MGFAGGESPEERAGRIMVGGTSLGCVKWRRRRILYARDWGWGGVSSWFGSRRGFVFCSSFNLTWFSGAADVLGRTLETAAAMSGAVVEVGLNASALRTLYWFEGWVRVGREVTRGVRRPSVVDGEEEEERAQRYAERAREEVTAFVDLSCVGRGGGRGEGGGGDC